MCDVTKKCAECGGRGKIYRRVPAVAMAFPGNPEDWKWDDQLCWRCKGDGIARALGINAATKQPENKD